LTEGARKTVDDRAPHLQLRCRARAVDGMPVYPARINCPQGCPSCNTRIVELIRVTKLSEASHARVHSERMTIARLLLAQPRVVILDEATAALDSTSEAAVQAALSEALEGRTAMVIAHRLSTIRSADLMLVVEDGSIVERGTHEEPLVAGGRYEELHRTQFTVQKNVAAEEEAVSGS
jgi:ABC-type glutathione transport system ATPase component